MTYSSTNLRTFSNMRQKSPVQTTSLRLGCCCCCCGLYCRGEHLQQNEGMLFGANGLEQVSAEDGVVGYVGRRRRHGCDRTVEEEEGCKPKKTKQQLPWRHEVCRTQSNHQRKTAETADQSWLTRPKIMSQLPDGPANSQHQTASSRQKCNPAPSQLSLSGFSSTRPLRRTRESENVFLIVYGRTSHPP
ncbi:Hypothetical protein SMAX5B_014788 [Scophthalmus maximus]|uniref:Uncharacterized protein n=1 Tax=Scophthalmus maximus TaxID=52904 RepID=A0A2U9C2C9_SCOMX|nr:Hypothetical protein SMAX5B_014788 [Scophthalmus maximus]AWP10170.1 Hypothetical protein SMAX5B_014788 [Scophthalmus maximus]